MRTAHNGLYRYHRAIRIIELLPGPPERKRNPTNSMLLFTPPRPTTPPATPDGASRRPERGQAMVEFAMVILPLLVVVVGIIQFGLIFGANVSLTNAAREGAREATIFRFNASNGHASEGVDRCSAAVEASVAAFGFLRSGAPNFSAATPCPSGSDLTGDGLHDRWTNGDVTVSYCAGATAPGSACPDPGNAATHCTVHSGSGCLVRVELRYNQALVVPLIDAILDPDGNGLFEILADAAMVMN